MGSAPGSMLVRGMFGIQPTSAGFDTFQVKVQPGGVKDGNVKVPTLKGTIEASYSLDGAGGISGTVTVPSNSVCELAVPSDNSESGIYVDGEATESIYEDGYIKCTVQPGTHSFSSSTSAVIDGSEWTKTDAVYSTYAKSEWSEKVTNGIESGKLSSKIESVKSACVIRKNREALSMRFMFREQDGLDWTGEDSESGEPGSGKRVEAYKIRLTGGLAEQYDVYYRAYVQSSGWLDWASNGEPAGTSGYSKEMYMIQIKLVKKRRRGTGQYGICL